MDDAQTPTPQMIFLPSVPSQVDGTDGFRLRDGSLLSERLSDDSAILPMLRLWAALTGAQKPAQKPAGGFVGIGYARSSAEAQESVERTREALARNIGNPTEQDWRDALQRAEARATDRR